jgi:hypothetical protein
MENGIRCCYLLIILVQVGQLEPKRVNYVMTKFLEKIGTSIYVIVCGTVQTSQGTSVEDTIV